MPRKDERSVRTAAAAARERSRSSDNATAVQRQRSSADVAFVDALARLLLEHDLAEIELTREYGEKDELQVRLSRYAAAAPATALVAAPAAPQPAPALAPPPAAEALPAAGGAESDPGAHPGAVASPMVGTIYLSAEPGAAPFVSEGAKVEEGQTLLIVEAMKTMNQIPSPRAGVVKKVLVENGQPVEFGAPLMIIE